MRAEAKLAKAATKAEASATPKDDMSAPIGAASNVEGGCARRAPDLEAFSVAMEDSGPDGDGGGKVQTNAAPDTDAHGETEAFAGAAEASEPAIGLGVGQCLCKGVCECLQVTTSVDEEGSPMTTMARLAVRGGGSGAPVPLGDGVQGSPFVSKCGRSSCRRRWSSWSSVAAAWSRSSATASTSHSCWRRRRRAMLQRLLVLDSQHQQPRPQHR